MFQRLRITTATDIYCLGSTMLHIFTGRRPWFGYDWDGIHELAVKQKRLPDSLQTVPAPIQDLLRKCYAFEPAARPSATEVLDELREILEGIVRDEAKQEEAKAEATKAQRERQPKDGQEKKAAKSPPGKDEKEDDAEMAPALAANGEAKGKRKRADASEFAGEGDSEGEGEFEFELEQMDEAADKPKPAANDPELSIAMPADGAVGAGNGKSNRAHGPPPQKKPKT